MQEKTIKKVLHQKFNHWIESIDDLAVRSAVKENTIITGGCITSLMLNEKPNDYDVYMKDKKTLLLLANYYANKFNEKHPFMENKLGKKVECLVLDGELIKRDEATKTFTIDDPKINSYIETSKTMQEGEHANGKFSGFSRMLANCSSDRVKMIIMSDGIAGELPSDSDEMDIIQELDDIDSKVVEAEVKEEYLPVFITTNAITLSNKIQIIVRFFGEPNDIHENYDYEHTKAYWSSWDNELKITKLVYECVINKTLKYTGSKYPICSVFRMRKFIERGWKINAGQILKMAFHINELNLSDIDVLEDQLVGVDSVYFNNLINQIKEQQTKDADFKWDFNYIISIIDRIF